MSGINYGARSNRELTQDVIALEKQIMLLTKRIEVLERERSPTNAVSTKYVDAVPQDKRDFQTHVGDMQLGQPLSDEPMS
jgi:hypothetical protein